MENLTTLCGGHHGAVHRGEITISGKAPSLVVERAFEVPHVGESDELDAGRARTGEADAAVAADAMLAPRRPRPARRAAAGVGYARCMRTFVVLATLALAAPVFADDGTGAYDVTYTDAGSTCAANPVTMTKGKLTIAVKKGALNVSFDPMFALVGKPAKDGAIDAKTTKLIGTSVGGLSARYAIVGHAQGGSVQLALTATYIRQDTNKPFCAQTWNVTGTKK